MFTPTPLFRTTLVFVTLEYMSNNSLESENCSATSTLSYKISLGILVLWLGSYLFSSEFRINIYISLGSNFFLKSYIVLKGVYKKYLIFFCCMKQDTFIIFVTNVKLSSISSIRPRFHQQLDYINISFNGCNHDWCNFVDSFTIKISTFSTVYTLGQ